ncbi:MATE family efflux transporter [Candidatus Woesearchaeota archaeon]|nr:MATE family efflux transporter [Candidatus Woesearchaeota archaeon]
MPGNRVDEFIKQPRKSLFILAGPILIAMLVQTMYSIVDTAFVGRLGAEALAALTFSFPLFFFLMSINSGIAVGVGSRISRFLGAKKKRQAENTALHGIFISLVAAVLIFILGKIFLEDIFMLFGAEGEVLILGLKYMNIIFMGIFFMFPTYIFNNIFTAQGDTKSPMIVQISALVMNMILDPIFIFVLNLGVEGAAIASVISFTFAFILSLILIRTRSYLKMEFKSFSLDLGQVFDIFKVGGPAMIMMLLMSFYVVFINRFMAHFSINHVAAFGVASRLESVVAMPIIAFSFSAMTLVGMFYGAKRYDLLRDISWFTIKIGVAFSALIGLIFFLFSTFFMGIFTTDMTLITIGAAYIHINVLTFPLMAVGMITSRIMQGLGLGMPGLIINLTRIVFVAIPVAYVFVYIFEYSYLSIAVAMVLGGIASNIVGLFWLVMKLKQYTHSNKVIDL